MKPLVGICLLAIAVGACGHKKPKEAKTSGPSTTTVSAPESGKCEVKGFAYSTPAPGPITAAAPDKGAP